MEANIITLKNGIKVYQFDTKSQADDFFAREMHRMFDGCGACRIKGLAVGMPIEVKNRKEAIKILRNVVELYNINGTKAYIAWLND